jgi:hypothetical protein
MNLREIQKKKVNGHIRKKSYFFFALAGSISPSRLAPYDGKGPLACHRFGRVSTCAVSPDPDHGEVSKHQMFSLIAKLCSPTTNRLGKLVWVE